MTRTKIFVILLWSLPLFGCSYFTQKSPSASTSQPGSRGDLIFDHDFHEFGTVTEGDTITHIFPFTNKGAGPVRLVKTRTSCGCTIAKTALKEYAPGESGELEVTVDTRGKRGITVKTIEVYLENGARDKVELTLLAKLVAPPHPTVENVLAINTKPECKTCHLDSGKGQRGGFLYHRVCAQCHGSKGKGASAAALNNREWLERVDDAFIRYAVVHGIPEQGMPPYVEGVSPPLSDEQIDSLIEYIRSWGE